MYKHHHKRLPSVLDKFAKNCDIHDHDTRQSKHLHIPDFSTDRGEMSFKTQAVMIWNKIIKFLKVDIKIGTFKKHLKALIISIGKLNESFLSIC